MRHSEQQAQENTV